MAIMVLQASFEIKAARVLVKEGLVGCHLTPFNLEATIHFIEQTVTWFGLPSE